MKTNSSDRSAQAIEISGARLAKWKTMLTVRKIGTTKKLLSRVPELMGEQAARKALNGQRLDRQTWEAIFTGLKLNRVDFFSDVEWFDRNLTTQWEILWNLATDASDRFGLVLPEHVPDSSLWDGVGSDKFQQTIASRTSVLLEIPGGFLGYLILVEQDALGNIVLLSPSPLMSNPVLTGSIQRLPQYPPSPFEFLQPITVGTNYLWAGIFAKLPELRWLADAQKRPLRLQMAQVTELLAYVSKQPPGTPLWRLSYVVTAS